MILNYFNLLIDIIYPPKCIVCKSDCMDANILCSECFIKISFITRPYCKKRGNSLKKMFGECSELNCIYDKHTYSQVISVFEYNDFSKKIITSFKFNDNFRLLKLFKSWLSYIISNVNYSDITYIIPVPLHKTKLKKRGFNQSLILAKIASRILGINYKNNILVKIKNTENQSDLKKSLREKNLKEAFSVNLKYKKLIEDKKVLLIDDIITTGSTANECSKTLLNNGAKEIRVISLAKR
ncbi:ComF family protein [Rickettsiales endosymbiont of Trichoplax sp. H2]|uniref:ComF family protein n=1 Tax=Rickettsiales endosymbiont of Trichoplax sp. H2 TaxID=2021221 RepID=UPI0012B1B885|nr:ComF family protein [Rickettsiales endosymbiont of Trichoplax sp. H2]